MFSPTSRYYNLGTATFTTANGRTIAYVRRRFLPLGQTMPLLVELPVVEGAGRDVVADGPRGDPENFGGIGEVKNARAPQDLIAAGPESKRRGRAPHFYPFSPAPPCLFCGALRRRFQPRRSCW